MLVHFSYNNSDNNTMASASNSSSSSNSNSNSTSKEQQLFQAAESGDRTALQAVLRDAIIAKPHQLGHPVCGILTGISAVSGADYYKSVSAAYGELVARGKFMAHNPRIVLSSVDCADYAVLVVEGRWDEVLLHWLVPCIPTPLLLADSGAPWLCFCLFSVHRLESTWLMA